MANPFSVDVVNPLQALLTGQQGYKAANDAYVADQKRSALAQLMNGGGPVDAQKAAGILLASGDTTGAGTFANLAANVEQRKQQSEYNQRDFAFKQEEAKRAQQNADRSYGLQVRTAARADDKTPSGFEKAPDGSGYRPIAGGPADPAYISSASKPRQLSVSDIGKLSDEGQKFGTLTSVSDKFRDDFGGYTPGTGGAQMTAGRYLPEGVVGKTRAEAASYWQEYDRYKNVVRNELFGSALTAGETKAFAQADVDPSMQPDQIRKNLARQKEIVEAGLKRKASAMIASGYSPDAIGKAYGVDLGSVGIGKPQQPSNVPQPGQIMQGYRFKGGDPGDQNNWVKSQ